MGEAKRKAAATITRFGLGNAEVVAVPRDTTSPWDLPKDAADLMVCEIGERGQLTRQICRDAADWMSKALDTQPGVMLVLTLGGFQDDPRELMDIPEAMQAFAWFGERMRELDNAGGTPRLLNRLESVTRVLVMMAMGLLPRDALVIETERGLPGDPVMQAQFQADRERVRHQDARYRAAAAAAAAKGGRQ